MRNCGRTLKNGTKGLPKIKLYKDEQGKPKGDALITYFKPESVDLCVRLLDDSAFRYNQSGTIRVQPVCFDRFH
jgi:HIV Tat-specific factor 1